MHTDFIQQQKKKLLTCCVCDYVLIISLNIVGCKEQFDLEFMYSLLA